MGKCLAQGHKDSLRFEPQLLVITSTNPHPATGPWLWTKLSFLQMSPTIFKHVLHLNKVVWSKKIPSCFEVSRFLPRLTVISLGFFLYCTLRLLRKCIQTHHGTCICDKIRSGHPRLWIATCENGSSALFGQRGESGWTWQAADGRSFRGEWANNKAWESVSAATAEKLKARFRRWQLVSCLTFPCVPGKPLRGTMQKTNKL